MVMPSRRFGQLVLVASLVLFVLENTVHIFASSQSFCDSIPGSNRYFSEQPSNTFVQSNSSASFTCTVNLSQTQCGCDQVDNTCTVEWHTYYIGHELYPGIVNTVNGTPINIVNISHSRQQGCSLTSSIAMIVKEYNNNFAFRCAFATPQGKIWSQCATVNVYRLETTPATPVTIATPPVITATPPVTAVTTEKSSKNSSKAFSEISATNVVNISGQQRLTAVVYSVLFGVLVSVLWTCQMV